MSLEQLNSFLKQINVEDTYANIFLIGLAILALSFVWLLIKAFQTRWYWGMFSLLLWPLPIVHGLVYFRKCKLPMLFFLIGVAMAGGTYAASYHGVGIDLGPRDRMVNGSRHITITDWDKKTTDYRQVFKKYADVVVLQMANKDVTDDIVAEIKPLQKLKELDLTDTRITDQSVPILLALPELESLRIARTHVTVTGLKTLLDSAKNLKTLDVRGLTVDKAELAQLIDAWRKQVPGRRAVK